MKPPEPPPSSQHKPSVVPTLILVILLLTALMIVWIWWQPTQSIPSNLGSRASVLELASYPHDPLAFTQGLIYWDGYLYESTGLYGQSNLRKVDITTGEVLQEHPLADAYFAEGLTLLGDKLYQLTWKEQTGFIYNLEDFGQVGTFSYPTEGWGLTTDGTDLILSDGTATLYFLDPQTMQTIRTIQVTSNGEPVSQLNELEYIRREIYANIWYNDMLVRIDPQDGKVLGQIDLSSLRTSKNGAETKGVLNGIAYDPQRNRLFVTGKNWSKIYEVKLVNKPASEDTLP